MARSYSKHRYQTPCGAIISLVTSQARVFDHMLVQRPQWREAVEMNEVLGTDEVKARMAEINAKADAAEVILIESRPSQRSAAGSRKKEYRAVGGVMKLQNLGS
jgi:hypothetical protein